MSSLKAAIAESCSTAINFEDDDGNVYAYRADSLFGVPSIQTGGHSDEAEVTDLGANIFPFIPIEENLSGAFQIGAGGVVQGTAYVFYFDDTGTQYVSTNNNTSMLTVTNLDAEENGDINTFTIVFSNVEVASVYDSEDKLCINAFELTYYSPED